MRERCLKFDAATICRYSAGGRRLVTSDPSGLTSVIENRLSVSWFRMSWGRMILNLSARGSKSPNTRATASSRRR